MHGTLLTSWLSESGVLNKGGGVLELRTTILHADSVIVEMQNSSTENMNSSE